MRLQARLGLTVIMVTHDPGDARHAGGRTAFVQAGRVVLVDETERVLGSQMPDVRAYLGASGSSVRSLPSCGGSRLAA